MSAKFEMDMQWFKKYYVRFLSVRYLNLDFFKLFFTSIFVLEVTSMPNLKILVRLISQKSKV